VCDPVENFLGESYVYLLESQHIADSIRQSHDETVRRLAAKVEVRGIRFELSRSREAHIAEVVRREAAARQPMYVVKGTHYHSPSERASLAEEDRDLIRNLDYPLWIVKPIAWNKSPVIVAAVDPLNAHDKSAQLDKRIIERARMVADECGGSLAVVHIYQTLEKLGSMATWEFKPAKLRVADINEKILREHERALNKLAKSCDLPDTVVHLLPGRAHEVLPAFAREQGASLVVMGALARSKLKQRIIGSTAARVLDHLHCDVLIAHMKPH